MMVGAAWYRNILAMLRALKQLSKVSKVGENVHLIPASLEDNHRQRLHVLNFQYPPDRRLRHSLTMGDLGQDNAQVLRIRCLVCIRAHKMIQRRAASLPSARARSSPFFARQLMLDRSMAATGHVLSATIGRHSLLPQGVGGGVANRRLTTPQGLLMSLRLRGNLLGMSQAAARAYGLPSRE